MMEKTMPTDTATPMPAVIPGKGGRPDTCAECGLFLPRAKGDGGCHVCAPDGEKPPVPKPASATP